jgi:3-deoxy-D-manno-octulosonic-acid transferase
MNKPFALHMYRAITGLAAPLAHPLLAARLREGKEERARLGERFGRSIAPRAKGPLVWLHGASVGETRVGLQVRAALAQARPDLSFLCTTMTRTAAGLFDPPPPRTVHQYVPLDTPAAARAFAQRWRPDLAIMLESDLWPNLLMEAQAVHSRLALVNARMSEKSLAAWGRRGKAAEHLFGMFDAIVAADQRTARGIASFVGRPIPAPGNLKLAAPTPPVDAATLAALRAACGTRPVWLAASTHSGEDEIALAAHARIRQAKPDALLIIAPRHPERGRAIAQRAGDAPLRSNGDPIGDAAVYVADTMGELSAFYALAGTALVAGSLLPGLKGHNPAEPARLRCAIVSGPHVTSFEETYALLREADAYIEARDADALAEAVLALWTEPRRRSDMINAAERAADDGGAALVETLALLDALLPDRAYAAA